MLPFFGGDNASREFALNEWELLPARTGVALSLRTARAKNAKLTVDLRTGAGEMYDLRADPHETHNLFDDPAAKSMRARLQEMINSRPGDMPPEQTPVGIA